MRERCRFTTRFPTAASIPAPSTSEEEGKRNAMADKNVTQFQTVGRRKSAVARVLMRPGSGQWSVNGRALAEYFPRSTYHTVVEKPFIAGEIRDVLARLLAERPSARTVRSA